MKRIAALLLVLLLLAGLSACRKQPASTPAAVPETADPAQAQDAAPVFPEEMVGSWILVDSNDTALTEKTFPGVTEKGGSMEIDAEGRITWTIGSDTGTGQILEVIGDEVSAQFQPGGTGDPVAVPGLLEDSTEAFAYYLHYSGVDLIWVRVPSQAQ